MPPGVYVALPSVFVTAKVTTGESVSLSEPLAVAPVGTSVATAVFSNGSVVMPGAKATGTMNTIVLAPPAFTRAPVVPKLVCPVVPVSAPQLDVPFATQVAAAVSVSPAGSASVTVTANASVGPLFTTVTT